MKHLITRKSRPIIVEYGPGESSMLMTGIAPEATVLSIEHKREWYEHYRLMFAERGLTNIDLKYIPDLGEYPGIPLRDYSPGTVDLVYIDGRRRIRCLFAARRLISHDGIVVLHDGERLHYGIGYWGWKKAKKISFGSLVEKTLVFVQNENDKRSIGDRGFHSHFGNYALRDR